MQTRRQSIIEVTTNTAVGMMGSWLIAYACMAAIEDRALAAAASVAGCTVWSLARGYYIRRRFAQLDGA